MLLQARVAEAPIHSQMLEANNRNCARWQESCRSNPSGQRNPLGRPLLVQSIKGFDGHWSPLLFSLKCNFRLACVVQASRVGRWRPTLWIVQVGTTVLLSCDPWPLLLRRVCEQNWLRSSWLLRVRAKKVEVVGVQISRGQRTLLVWRQASCAIHISGWGKTLSVYICLILRLSVCEARLQFKVHLSTRIIHQEKFERVWFWC